PPLLDRLRLAPRPLLPAAADRVRPVGPAGPVLPKAGRPRRGRNPRLPARCRLVGARLHLAAGAAERRRSDRLALTAVDARPDRVVHALKGDEAAAGI